jgi:hypothetical protein
MKLEMGTVPAWIGAFSFVLALGIFRRDHANTERAQVDAMAIWWEIERELKMPGDARVEQIKLRMCVRNGSNLPVELTYVSPIINTRWMVPSRGGKSGTAQPDVWDIVQGSKRPDRFFGPVDIPPQAAVESDWIELGIAHLAPEGATQLDPSPDAVRCTLRWALVRDNAGRRWQTRHAAGKRAKRIRWWSRHDPYFPYDWKNLAVRQFWKVREGMRAKIKRS